MTKRPLLKREMWGVADIHIPERRMRPLIEENVVALMPSMAALGLLNPITVRVAKEAEVDGNVETGIVTLVAGLHRLEAARRLGWQAIDCTFVDDDALRAELLEIDENLCRSDLTAAERASAQARRKAIYQELHPETKNGGDRRSVAQLEQLKDGAPRFDEAAAEASGQSPATVRRDVHRGEALGDDALAKVARTSLDKGEELDALVKLSEEKRTALIDKAAAGKKVSAKVELKKEQRDNREKLLGAIQRALPDKKYGVIVDDYEWDYKVWGDGGMDRHAANHYPTSKDAHTAAEIVERTKDRFAIAADNCIHFMWATIPHLAIALDVMRLRGFEYRSHYVWCKDRIGLGHWNREKHELLLIGVRGHIDCPAKGTQWESYLLAPKGAHSAKPERFLEMVETYFPTLPKIELNRRGPARPGWDAWGNETVPSRLADDGSPTDPVTGEIGEAAE